MGSRPSVTLYPDATVANDTSTPYDWVNPENALGAPDGTYASSDISAATVGTSGDTQNFTFTVDAALSTCRISAFEYTFVKASSPGASLNDIYGWIIQPMTNAGVIAGEPEGTHEFGGDERDAGSRTYQGPEGPSGTTLFSSGAILGTSIQTFATWGGFRLAPYRTSPTASLFPIQFDALKVRVFYTPVDLGATSTTLAPTGASTTEATAASLGLSVPSGLDEIAWTNPANAFTANTARATIGPNTSGGYATAGYVSRFIKYVFPSGLLAAASGRYPRELRVALTMQVSYLGENPPMEGSSFVDEANPDLTEMYALLDELVLLDSAGNILMQLQDPVYDRDPYGSKTWRLGWMLPLGMLPTGATSTDRPTQFVLDVAGMTPAQVADMHANGFSIALRFRADRHLFVQQDSGYLASEIYVNHAIFSLSHDASAPALPPLLSIDANADKRKNRVYRLNRLQRA